MGRGLASREGLVGGTWLVGRGLASGEGLG